MRKALRAAGGAVHALARHHFSRRVQDDDAHAYILLTGICDSAFDDGVRFRNRNELRRRRRRLSEARTPKPKRLCFLKTSSIGGILVISEPKAPGIIKFS
jgi:hypothetical protein